jgi:hypothetical protein
MIDSKAISFISYAKLDKLAHIKFRVSMIPENVINSGIWVGWPI